MLHELITVNDNHINAAELIAEKVMEADKDKFIVSITGEVGTGKSTISYVLGKILKQNGIRTKIIDLDDYYKIPPIRRTAWRKKHGPKSIGYDEYDWDRIALNIKDFKANKKSILPCIDLITDYVDEITTDFSGVDILLINGLYSMKCQAADIKFFLDMNYQQTLSTQYYTNKEEMDDFRKEVLHLEHHIVQSLKGDADYLIDFSKEIKLEQNK